MTNHLFGFLILFLSPVLAWSSEVMFEGYSKIELAGKHVGYAIQKFEFDPKSKQFTSTSFLRAKFGDKMMQESLKAKANDKFHPLSYQYTSVVGDETKTIDASFKGTIMKLKISEKGKMKNETHKVPEGTFLSTFLIYMMLQKKLTTNTSFKYSGIAEEDGGSYWGRAVIEAQETQGPHMVFKIKNSFKGQEFVSRLAAIPNSAESGKFERGEVLGTESASQSIKTELVASASLATEGQMVPNKVLATLFGSVPLGKVNLLNSSKTP